MQFTTAALIWCVSFGIFNFVNGVLSTGKLVFTYLYFVVECSQTVFFSVLSFIGL